jgi:hypothetical protein
MKPVKIAILICSGILTALSVTLIAAIHLHGNHAIGADGTDFQSWVAVGVTVVTCLSTLLLAIVLCNCRTLLGNAYWRVALGGGVLLLCCEVATFAWLRAGLEHSMVARDQTAIAAAQTQAWDEIEAKLQTAVAQAQADPSDAISLRAEVQTTRNEIADLAAQAATLDNDGIRNDGQIPGLLAAAESRKADLANLESRLAAALDRKASAVAEAAEALQQHQKSRAEVLTVMAAAQTQRHQFVRWAGDLRSLFPKLSEPFCLQVVLSAVAFSLMVPQYAGLAGVSAALKMQTGVPAQPAAPSNRRRRKPMNVIDGKFLPEDRASLHWLAQKARELGVIRNCKTSLGKYATRNLRTLVRNAQSNSRFRSECENFRRAG